METPLVLELGDLAQQLDTREAQMKVSIIGPVAEFFSENKHLVGVDVFVVRQLVSVLFECVDSAIVSQKYSPVRHVGLYLSERRESVNQRLVLVLSHFHFDSFWPRVVVVDEIFNEIFDSITDASSGAWYLVYWFFELFVVSPKCVNSDSRCVVGSNQHTSVNLEHARTFLSFFVSDFCQTLLCLKL
jgi:hypothetical protein